MAQLPLPRRSGPDPGLSDGSPYAIGELPDAPRRVLVSLARAGHEAALVGGCLRDLLRGDAPGDWDVATAALPEQVARLLPGSTWENRFGTVALPGPAPVEITTYRSESSYTDRRRPDQVAFHGSLTEDLARRDFTINAIAWLPDAPGSSAGHLVDPHGGLDDLRAGVIRAVGTAADRFAEDALRILRGVRFALRFGFATEAETESALEAAVPLTAGLSGERVRDELLRLLADPHIQPSAALERWDRLGLLAALLPELAALRGVPQSKPRGGDALDHAAWTVDALPAGDPVLRLAGLLHDLGKAETLSGGHFIGHEVVGADLAERLMRRLRFGGRDIERVRQLVRQHMFAYEPGWSDAAVRRFIQRVGRPAFGDLFALRVADDAASGAVDPADGGLAELRRRIAEQDAAPTAHRHLAVDGHDLQAELGIGPGPEVGRLLHRLLEAVLEDPRLNDREQLFSLARQAREER